MICGANVGKYSIPYMEHMGIGIGLYRLWVCQAARQNHENTMDSHVTDLHLSKDAVVLLVQGKLFSSSKNASNFGCVGFST